MPDSEGIYSTACPRNCYSTCSLTVTVQDGRITAVAANPSNRATPHAVCLKGLSYIERAHSSERITQVLKRKGGDFVPISWLEALDIIAEKVIGYRDRFGPQSIFFYYGSGTKGLLNGLGAEFWRLVGGYTSTYGDLCWPAGLEATRLTLGENKHSAPWDLENARLIILWGKNAAETNVHQMTAIDRALERGGKLVVIDPRRTQSAATADLLIQPRPGTDGALALGLAHLLIKNNWLDKDFIEKYVLGFPPFRRYLEGFSDGEAASICGVPREYIRQLAEYIGRMGPVSIVSGFGMQRYTNSGQTVRSLIALLALTGNIGRPGAGWIYANLQSSIFDTVRDPIAFFPPEHYDGVARISISTARLGRDMLAASNPALKMAWIERGNPVTQNPDTHLVLKAIRQLEFRVVIEQFMTDTAREADIILPSKTMFEQSDVIGAYWHSYIQLKQKVIDPPAEVKPESEIYYLLARRLGFSEQQLRGIIPPPGDQHIDTYLRKKLKSFPGLSLEALKRGPVPAPGMEEVAFADLCFPTPSGKIELQSEEAAIRWRVESLPEYRESVESNPVAGKRRFPLNFMTPNSKNRIHSQFNNLDLIRQFSRKPVLEINPGDAQSRGISDGGSVRIYNDRGELKLTVRLDFSIRAGCVSVSNGWWISEGGTVNFLSCGRETDMGYGAAYHDNLVEVEKLP